ncbi:putative very-long-chain 3-oxoacyl-CoA reductase [Helianthus annuus]|nr:putative very-long-chain 3-oxoacyl-CoA reductase [Helianthus annuus]
MAARNLEAASKCKETIIKGYPSATIDVMELDVSSLESVTKFANELHFQGCNAGVMAPPFSLSKDGIESQFATNYLGHFHLTNLLLDTMKHTARSCGQEGRIVLVSSVVHRLTYKEGIMFDKLNEKSYNSYYAYGQSKLANILHAKELARRLKEEGAGITINALHPEVIATNLSRHSNFMSGCLIWSLQTLSKEYHRFRELQQLCYLALNPKVKGVSGEYFADNNVYKPSDKANDAELAKKTMGIRNGIDQVKVMFMGVDTDTLHVLLFYSCEYGGLIVYVLFVHDNLKPGCGVMCFVPLVIRNE